MKKVEFIQFEENSNSLKITEENFINLIESSGLISIIKEYQIPEEFLIKHREILDKNIIIDNLHLSEDFIKSALTLEYFENEDIKNFIKWVRKKPNHFITKNISANRKRRR